MGSPLITPKTPALVGLVNASTATAYLTNASLTATPQPVDSATATGNRCMFPCGLNHTLLWFIGTNAANEDYHAKVLLWRKAMNLDEIRPTAASNAATYFPVEVGIFVVTLGAMTGQASSVVANTYYFADTITASDTQSDSIVRDIWSPADDTAGHVLFDTLGYQYLEVQFDKDAGSSEAATCNALVARI